MKNSNRKTFFMFLMAFLVAFFIVSLVGVLRSSFTTSGAPEIPVAQAVPAIPDAVVKTPLSFSELTERVKPAVVNISTSKTLKGRSFGTPFGRSPFGGSPSGDRLSEMISLIVFSETCRDANLSSAASDPGSSSVMTDTFLPTIMLWNRLIKFL